jgi:flagellar biosynthesis/type III secretory pathway protein FliH
MNILDEMNDLEKEIQILQQKIKDLEAQVDEAYGTGNSEGYSEGFSDGYNQAMDEVNSRE